MSFPVRSVVLAVLAAAALAGCVTAPYGGYSSYGGSAGYGGSYGGSYGGTQTSGYPSYPQPSYPQQTYPQQGYPQQGYPQPYPAEGSYGGYGNEQQYGVRYGWVETIEMLPGQSAADTSGAGAVVGGLLGGLLGHQVGRGRGNTVATIGGAVAGALAGNEVEKRAGVGGTQPAFRIRVRTNDNSYLTVTQTSAYNLRNGDRVRVENGVAAPY